MRKKRSRFLRFGNSSSSSVNSDLAYGKGYVERRRSREFSPPNSAGRPALSQRGRAQTDEEILELGRKFAEIARQQNAEDLRAAGRSRPSGLIGAATALSQFRRTNSGHSTKGVGSSKTHRDSSPDDSEWESASDDDSSSSEFDSGLAYGSGLSLPNTSAKAARALDPPRPSRSPRSPQSPRSPRPLRAPSSLQAPNYDPPLHRKPSVVDPNLFGPVNSLRGYVETPCGFEKVDRSTLSEPRRPYEPSIPPSEAISETRPLQRVYPVPTSDPGRFDARGSVVSSQHDFSTPPRPAPVPIQQPKPIAPVSRKVLDTVETDSRFSDHSLSRKSIGEAAIAGVAGAALGAALSSDRRDDHERHEGKRDRDGKRRSKRLDIGAADEKVEKRRSRDVPRDEPREEPREGREDRFERRREKRSEQDRDSEKDRRPREMMAAEAERESEKEKRRRDKYRDEGNDYDRERRERRDARNDARNDDRKDERKIDRNDIRRGERASRSDLESYKRLEGSEPLPKEGPVDPFQYQVADDAFQTPLNTTPKRPLTPSVITVDREPDFSRFERMADEVRPLERLSRKDSYERDLRNAHEIYEVAEHATAPVNEAAFAVATAAIMAEDRRGRSRSRGSDASSMNRSHRDEAPTRGKDSVQADADRYYREAELARRIQEEDRRFHAAAESSVIDKWKHAKEPVVVDIVAPPEMNHPKKKSPYDGPDADVRIDNVLEHPKELSRFRTPDIKGLAASPIFKARDPSAERERPMLNVVRPTPVPTPTLEVRRLLEEPPSESAAETDNDTTAYDVVIGPRGEVIPAPPTPKAVSWGENQTKHYVVESPEREDDPYSGAKIITPAKPPRSRSGRKSGWGVIAAAVGGTSGGAASSSTTDPVIDSEVTRTGRVPRDGEKTTSRRSSAQLEGMYDSPPVPGPKPPSPRSAQMPGAFAEDPVFTANIAAALQGSGFDPNIVIDNASFHRRDSPPGSNDSDVYHSPFVESVIDLGSSASQNNREHGFVLGEMPETPSDEKDIPANKSDILSRLKELRKQQSAAGHGGPEGPEIFNDSKAGGSRSIAEDEWDVPSSKPSKKERRRLEKSTQAQPAEEDVQVDDASRTEQDLEAEFGVGATTDEGQDSLLKRKKSKKSKKAIVVQGSSKQPDMESPKIDPTDDSRDVKNAKVIESPKVTVPPSAFSDSQSAEAIEQDTKWDLPKDNRRPKRNSEAYESARSALASQLSTESSYRVVDAESLPATDDEWDTPNSSRRESGAYSSLSRSAQASEISLELARRRTLPVSLSDDEQDILSKKKNKRNTIDDEFSASFARSTDDLSGSRDSRTTSRRSSRAYESLPHEELSGDIVESPIEMTESFSDLRSEKTAATEESDVTPKKSKKKSKRGSVAYEDIPSTPRSQTAPSEASVTSSKRSKQDSYTDSPSRSAPGSEVGTDDSRKKSKKKKKRRSTSDGIADDGNTNESEPPDKGRDRFEAVDRDISSVVSDPSRYDDHKSSRSRRSEVLDDTKSVASAPGSADRRDRKSSKSEKDTRNNGNSGFFDRLKSSIGIAEEKGRQRKSEEDKKNSFLDNAGTLGAGVGSTGAAIAPVSQESRSNATNNPLEEETQIVPTTPERQSTGPREVEFIDPEIVPREIRPAIDPKYGDLLPLPPSLPGSPVPELGDNFPPLPDSRPESPEHERHLHEMPTHARRRSGFETPHRPKTPSQGAIPLQFLLGHKATPESPSTLRSPSVRSPSASPVTGISEFSERRRRPRPTSWESSREFKPLLLLQRAFRESTSMRSSPERESSPGSERLQELSPSRSEDREHASQSESHIPAESPDLDLQPHESVPDTPVQSASRELVETPSTPHVTESISHSPTDRTFDPPSNELLHRQATKVDDTSHLPSLLESSDLPLPDSLQVNVEHEVDFQEPFEQPLSEFVENIELKSPKPELKLIVPNSDAPSLHTAQEPDADILPISPTLVSGQKSTELSESLKDSLEDNFKDATPVIETAKSVPEDVQVMTVLDDRGPSRETDTLAMQSKDIPTSHILTEGKVAPPTDALDISKSDDVDTGLVELSSFLETLHDDDNAQREKGTEVKELPEVSINTETLPVQDEAVYSDAVTEQVPVIESAQEPTIQEPAAVEISTKEAPEISEHILEQALKNDEFVEPPLSKAPALETRDEPPPKEVPREIVEVPQPEPETSSAQQNTSTSSKKGKKKKKNRKSQATVPILDDQPVVTQTRDASLDELPSRPTEEIAITPAEFTPISFEGEPSTIEEKPPTGEGPATIEKEFAGEEMPITSEPEVPTAEAATEKESSVQEKPSTSNAQISTVEPVDDEPRNSAWSFWGATKKSTKKENEAPQTTTVDNGGSWLDWGKKKIKGTADTPVETKEMEPAVAESGKQQPSVEKELADPTISQEESAKVAELTLEDNPQNPDALPGELQTSTQDQLEAAIFQEQSDVRPSLPEESPSTTKKSKKKKGKKAQNLEPEPEPEPETTIEQTHTEQENRSLPEANLVPAVQEVEAGIQADNQTPDNTHQRLVEIPANPQETELKLDTRPEDNLISKELLSDESPKPDETSRDNEETSQEISSPSGLFEPLSSNPETDGPHELQSALLSDAGPRQQPNSTLEPVLGEDQLRSDTNKPEDLVVASVVQEDPNSGQEHEGEPTLTGASLQGLVEQEPSGSKSLEHIVDDESPLQPNLPLPSGEDPREQDPASTDPLEAPLSGAILTENLENKSVEQQTEAVEEPAAFNVVADDAQPSSLPTEPVAQEPQEMALSREDVGSKKKGKRNKKKRQDTSEVVESPIATETFEEPTLHTAEPETNLDEPLVISDVPEQPAQKSPVLAGIDSLQELTGTTELPKSEQDYRDSEVVDVNEQPEVLKSEEPRIQPQTDTETAQGQIAEQTGDDVGLEAESSSKKSKKGKKNRQSIDETALGSQPEPSKPVEEPVIKEIAIDDNQLTEVITASPSENDVAADSQLEKDPAPGAEIETVLTKKKSKKDKKKRGSTQLESAVSEETTGELVVQGDANREVAPQTEPILNVSPTTGDEQVTQAQEVEEWKPISKKAKKGKRKQSQSRNDTEIVTPVTAPDILPKPSATSEEFGQIPEDSNTGLTSNTEILKEDSKRQSVQFADPLEQGPMEIPAEIAIDPAVQFPETDTAFNSDWASADIPPPPDFWAESESHHDDAPSSFDDSLKTQYDPSQNQSVDPLFQHPETIETEKQAEALGNEEDKLTSHDVNIASVSEPPFEKNTEALESTHVDETKDQLLADTTPKDELDIAQQSSAEAIPVEQQSTEDQKSIEADIVEEPTTRNESQIVPIPTDQDRIPTEADAVEIPHPQIEIGQLEEDQAKANDETTPQVEELALVAPAISEDAESRDLVEPPSLSEPSAEPILSTAAEEESPILAKKSKKDKKKKRKSKTQDALDSTSGTATPAEESIIESPSSQQINPALATTQDQTEPTQLIPDVPMNTEPEQLVPESQPQEDEPQTSVAKKSKKDKKKKKKGSQIQEPEPSSLPTEEIPVKQPQSPIPDSSQLQTVDSSELPLPQETELKHPLQEDVSDQPALPVPETSEAVADTSQIPISATQEPEPQLSEPADIPIQHEDTEQERTIEGEKTSDDVPVVEHLPVATSSSDYVAVSEFHKPEEIPQVSDVTPIPEQEPVVEQPLPSEEPEENVATPKSKKDRKKKKKRDSQAPPDDAGTDPSQDISASVSGITTPVEQVRSLADSAAPVSVKDSEPTVELSDLTENTGLAASQDISEPVPDVQPTTEIRDFAEILSIPAEPPADQLATTTPMTELDLQGSEKISTESKEGQDIQAVLPDDDASQQVHREQVKEVTVTPAPLEQTEINEPITAATSKDEDTTELAPTKKGKKGKKKKKSQALNDAQPQEEPTGLPQDTTSDIIQPDTSTLIPQEISKDDESAELELPKSEADQEKKSLVVDDSQPEPTELLLETASDTRQVEASIYTPRETSGDEKTSNLELAENREDQEEKPSTLDDLQPQEEQSKLDTEILAPSVDKPLETTVPESSKDENTDEAIPTKKNKKGKKKKRTSLLEDTAPEQQESTQTTSDPVTDTPATEQVETEKSAMVDISKDEDTQDVTSSKKSKRDKKKKKRAGTLEVEPEPEPSAITQPVELSTEASRSDMPPINSEDAILAEESLPADLSEIPHVPTSDNQLPVTSTQDEASLVEKDLPTQQPVEVIEEQISEQSSKNIITAPLTSDTVIVDATQPDVTGAAPLEVNSQVPDYQAKETTLSVSPAEYEPLSLTEDPVQQSEESDIKSKIVLPEEQAESTQLKEPPMSEEPTHPEEYSKLDNPTEQGELVQAREPSKPEEPVQVDESSKLEESPKPEELVNVEGPTPADQFTPAQESAQTEEPVRTEFTPQEPLEAEEPVQLEESLEPKESLQPAEIMQTEYPLAAEGPLQQDAHIRAEEPSKQDESAQLEKSLKLEETPQLEKATKSDVPTQLEDPALQEPSEIESMQPDVLLKSEEIIQSEEPTQQEFPKAEESKQIEEPALIEEPAQLEPTQLEQPPVILDEPEIAPAKKSKKDKKKKKKASQAESDPVSESVRQIEESQAQASLPEQSHDQDNSMVLPEAVESKPVVEDPTTIAKDSEDVEETFPEVTTGKKSKKKKKRASQLVPQPAPETTLPADEPAGQSPLPEQLSLPEQPQPEESKPTLERALSVDEYAGQALLPEQSYMLEQSSLSKEQSLPDEPSLSQQTQAQQSEEPYPVLERALLADEPAEQPLLSEEPSLSKPSLSEQTYLPDELSIPEQPYLPEQHQEPQPLDSQPITEATPVTVTDVVSTEDVIPETSTSKKSKKKKKRASQVDRDLEADISTPLESPAQLPLLEEPLVQEPLEQLDSVKAEEPVVVKEDKNPEVIPEVSSKKSKKEKRKAKKLTSSTIEPELESDLKLEEQPTAVEVEPSYPEQYTELVNLVSETTTPLATDPTPTNLKEHLEPPTTEAELSLKSEKDQSADIVDRHEGEISEPIVQKENEPANPEQDLTVSRVENEVNGTSLDNTTDVIPEATQQPAHAPVEVSTKDVGRDDNKTRGEPSLDVTDTALPSQDLANTEKQDEAVASRELLVAGEPAQAELSEVTEPSKIPEMSSTEQQEQMLVDQPIQPDVSLPKEQEPEPEPAPVSRKKSKKNKKKKKADTQAESEPASGTQTPLTPIGISNDVARTDTMTGEPERTITNEGEWPESLPKSKDENSRTASGTFTPLESMEDAPVDAQPETVTEENIPGNLTLEEISAVEGQSSKAKDVPEKYSEPKDKDANAEDINISHPTGEDVIVPENNQLAPPAEEEQLVQPDEGPANETVQDNSDHVELSVPASRPRTPTPIVPPPAINVDLSPAQLSSHVEHERPFDQSPQPGKKARTELSIDDAMIPVSLSAQDNIPPQNIESSTYGVPELLQPEEQDTTKVEDGNAVPGDVTPAREIAASYLESQPMSMDDTHDYARENNDAEQTNTSGLFPMITPRREIAASYFDGYPATVQTDDCNMPEDNIQEPSGSTRPSTLFGGVSISPPDAQSTHPDPEHVEEKTIPVQPDDEPRQPSPVQDTESSAREVAATFMESHLKPSRREIEMHKETEPIATTKGLTLSPEGLGSSEKQRSFDKGSLDTDNMLDDPALRESSQPRALEEGGLLNTDAGDFRGPNTETDDQTRAPSSPDAMEVEVSNDLPKRPAEQQDVTTTPENVEKVDIESPVIGREVQHELPEPRNAGHESPKSSEPPTSEIIENLDDLDTSEHLTEPTGSTGERKIDAGSLKSISPTRSYMSSGRASPRVLPPVEEETHEDLEKERQTRAGETTDKITIPTEANRDSGVVTYSPHPMRRSLVEASQRDSGVHLHDWPETAPKREEGLLQEEGGAIQTPQSNEKRTKKLGLGGETPRLSTPTVGGQNDEMRDAIDPKKTRPSTRSSTPSSAAAQESGQRSVSDNISRRSTPLAERQLRRTASNTSISRLRTPEPLRFRPDSPSQSAFRSGTNTPPLSLRRVDKRMSGDLRSLSSNLSNNVSRENLHQSQPSTTPVANEGRVRAKDMTDVYVSNRLPALWHLVPRGSSEKENHGRV